MTGTLGRQRVVPAVALLAAIPLFRSVDGWVALAVAGAVMWLLIAWELHQYRGRAGRDPSLGQHPLTERWSAQPPGRMSRTSAGRISGPAVLG